MLVNCQDTIFHGFNIYVCVIGPAVPAAAVALVLAPDPGIATVGGGQGAESEILFQYFMMKFVQIPPLLV